MNPNKISFNGRGEKIGCSGIDEGQKLGEKRTGGVVEGEGLLCCAVSAVLDDTREDKQVRCRACATLWLVQATPSPRDLQGPRTPTSFGSLDAKKGDYFDTESYLI